MIVLLLAAGLVLLLAGGSLLVRGASRLAAAAGISPLVVGLTVVAFGTSAPEMAASIGAALRGQGDIAFGNVVGSNIFNVFFILGASALLAPLVVAQRFVRVEVPILLGVSVAMFVLGQDGNIGRLEGAALFLGLVAYTAASIRSGSSESVDVRDEYEAEYGGAKRARPVLFAPIACVVGGLALLVVGSGWFVEGAVALARALGTSELIIGLTIVAAGTSLPEVVTSLLAAAKGERDIAVGNVIGSNIFNILGVLGLSALAAPGGVPSPESALRFDVPVMIAAAFACLPIFFTGNRIDRWEGAVLLGYYIAYVAFLILDASDHDRLPAFSGVMLAFVLPLTGVTLGILTVREARRLRRPAP